MSGSLRARSSNTVALRAAALLAAPGIEVGFYQGLDALPHFNPDLDREGATPPPAVAAWRSAVGGADALLISSPEYAHGVPGSLKNALDWLVSYAAVVGLPVGLINVSSRSTHAPAALAEILRTMAMTVAPDASITLPPGGAAREAVHLAHDPETAQLLRGVLSALVQASVSRRSV